ncbi:hypothetical protein [Chitinophaga sp. MM2321]|uniref:hypothetical protein n=1 Tax=Chitinophaga sp. MM2321 TaxID=3137178 RepID=UPI0032D5A1CD
MAKIRTVKPEFWEDEKIGKLKREPRLLFLGMFNFADDQGVIKSNPVYIKSRVFPYDDDLRVGVLQNWLDALVQARMLIPFQYKGEGYYVIRTFNGHQKIDQRYARYSVDPKFVKPILDKDLIDHAVNTPWPHREHTVNTSQEMEVEVEVEVEGRGNTPAQEIPNPLQTEKSEDYTPGAENLSPPVAPPPSSGPPLEDVIRFFRGAGGNEEMAEKFWNKWDGVGWVDRGSRIVRWASLANNFITNYHENEQRNKRSSGGGGNGINSRNGGFNIVAGQLRNELEHYASGGTAGFGNEI